MENPNKPTHSGTSPESARNGLADRALAAAAELGRDAGRDAAEWIEQDSWGGRVARSRDARENAAAFLKTFEEGGSFFFDIQAPCLSEHYNGGAPHAALLSDICWDLNASAGDTVELQAEIDALCDSWQDACNAAFWDALEASARAVVESEGNQ